MSSYQLQHSLKREKRKTSNGYSISEVEKDFCSITQLLRQEKKSYSTLLTFYILKCGYAIDINNDVP